MVSVLLKSRVTRAKPGAGRVLQIAACALAACWLQSIGAASAQDTVQQMAANRAAMLARLPPDAAQRLFGLATSPAPGAGHPIGGYTKGCLGGAIELPADGPNWQVMRPSRNRAWGHPALIAFLKSLAASAARDAQWPGLLVGDMAQPRGGPMLTGHASHQLGLEADIWLVPMPERRLSPTERDEMSSTNVVAADGNDIDPEAWRPEHRKLLETAARMSGVARIFVNPAIKRALCREAGSDRGWLHRIRPWWGHNYHFHVRLDCPGGEHDCHGQPPVPDGDGCGAELDWWFTREGKHPKPTVPAKPLRLSDLPAACAALVPREH
jgi:penicillin-insensitive murein endopeptidase